MAGFIMLPVYTRILSADDYGIIEILSLTMDVLSMLAGLGIGMAVVRYYYRYTEQADQHAVVSTAAMLSLAVFVTLALIGLAAAGPITAVLLGEEQPVAYVRIAGLSFAAAALSDVPLAFLRARQRSSAVVAASVSRLLLALTLNIVFVVHLRLGVSGALYSTLLSSLVVGAVLTVRMFRETGFRLVPSLVAELVVFGAPLMVAQIGSFVLHFSDRYFLRAYVSLAAVGLYSLAYKLAMVVSTFIVAPFNAIWVPTALQVDREHGVAGVGILRDILRQYNLALVTVSVGIALFAPDAIRIMAGPAFRRAAEPLPLLVLGMVFFGYRQLSQVGSVIGQRPRYVAYSTSIAAASVILLNAVLIPRWGTMGAAGATAGAFMLDFFVMRRLSARAYPLDFPLRELLPPLLLGAGVWAASAVVVPTEPTLVLSLTLHALAMSIFVALLFVTGIITARERALLRTAMQDPRGLVRRLRNR
jgi:O-antigen/teichoic acid export membrane protein